MINIKELNMRVGSRFREKRKVLGLSADKVAEAVGISTPFLFTVESGKKSLSYENLIKMCSVLCVSTDYILLGKENCDNENVHYRNSIEILNNLDDKSLPHAETTLANLVKIIATFQNHL